MIEAKPPASMVMNAIAAHAEGCARCREAETNDDLCEIGRGLVRLARKAKAK